MTTILTLLLDTLKEDEELTISKVVNGLLKIELLVPNILGGPGYKSSYARYISEDKLNYKNDLFQEEYKKMRRWFSLGVDE